MYFIGEEARQRLLGLPMFNSDRFPPSTTDYRFYDGGNFNGLNLYLTFTCACVDDCFEAIRVMDGPSREGFQPWRPSRLGVIMDGPRYGIEGFDPSFWPIRTISNGLQIERISGRQALTFYAVDLNRRMVYYQRSTGGFDDGPPKNH